MTETPWILWMKIHGSVSLLGIALCFHPAVALSKARRPSRYVALTGYLASGLVTLTNALGWFIYPAYREEVKQPLYLEARWWGQAFEVKEHLAHYAMSFAVAGAVLMLLARGAGGRELRVPTALCYALAAAMGLITAALGVGVASMNQFAPIIAP